MPLKREQAVTTFLEDMASIHRLLASTMPGKRFPKDAPTRSQFGLMVVLSQEGPLVVSELAKHFCMSSSAVTQLVDALVSEKILLRTAEGTDRRKISVSLTEKGKKKLRAAKKARLASATKLLMPLSDREMLQLISLQRKIVHSLGRS